MSYLYNLLIYFYGILFKLFSLKNEKAKLRLEGLVNWEESNTPQGDIQNAIWIHCASLGEFEQARPIIEEIKKNYSDERIMLSFFSASGYENQKDYSLADFICYMPFDTKKNAREFIKKFKPKMALFIKYEFWPNFINELHHNKIKIYSVASIFREDQYFFKWYGTYFLNALRKIDKFLVQNSESKALLKQHGINNSYIIGDTRFDRVLKLKTLELENDLLNSIELERFTLVAGSTWAKDEEYLAEFWRNNPIIRIIIAPHEFGERYKQKLSKTFETAKIAFLSEQKYNLKNADIIVIDTMGLLSKIYRFADVAYVGGGFGVGIHNILEAAVYSKPVIFGPKYQKFNEAVELINEKGAFSVGGMESLDRVLIRLIKDKEFRNTTGGIAGNYVENKSGVALKAIEHIFN
jgi:3-deoxy-D-manno-octulosonic-acid transferase